MSDFSSSAFSQPSQQLDNPIAGIILSVPDILPSSNLDQTIVLLHKIQPTLLDVVPVVLMHLHHYFFGANVRFVSVNLSVAELQNVILPHVLDEMVMCCDVFCALA